MEHEVNKEFIQKSKLLKTNDKEYPYNVQIWNSIDSGKTFCYTGEGRFLKTKEEADAYIKELEERGIEQEKGKERGTR